MLSVPSNSFRLADNFVDIVFEPVAEFEGYRFDISEILFELTLVSTHERFLLLIIPPLCKVGAILESFMLVCLSEQKNGYLSGY